MCGEWPVWRLHLFSRQKWWRSSQEFSLAARSSIMSVLHAGVICVFSWANLYTCVCMFVVVPTFCITSSIATSYTIHPPCQNIVSFVGADPFVLHHSYSTPCARIRRTNDASTFFTQSTPYSSLNIRTLYDSDDERSSACWARKNRILVPFLIWMSRVARSNTHAKISPCTALIFNAFVDEYRLLRTFLGATSSRERWTYHTCSLSLKAIVCDTYVNNVTSNTEDQICAEF